MRADDTAATRYKAGHVGGRVGSVQLITPVPAFSVTELRGMIGPVAQRVRRLKYAFRLPR